MYSKSKSYSYGALHNCLWSYFTLTPTSFQLFEGSIIPKSCKIIKSCVICTTSLDNYDGQLFIPSSFSTKINKVIDEMKESKNIMWVWERLLSKKFYNLVIQITVLIQNIPVKKPFKKIHCLNNIDQNWVNDNFSRTNNLIKIK